MQEKDIECKLIQTIKAMGGIATKFISPGFDGMPDRLLLLPGGRIAFVEVKSTGCKPRPLQARRHDILRSLGFKVYVIDDIGQIGSMLIEIGGADNV